MLLKTSGPLTQNPGEKRKERVEKKAEIIKNSAVNNKVPLLRKDDSHCRFISQILPVYLNIYSPHTDMFLSFHTRSVNRYQHTVFCSCFCDCVFVVLDTSSLQPVSPSWKGDHTVL